ncbi:MAG TPA: hypothetical protein VL981_10885 [Candidatus Methylacidiphilales bacterium]|nr:hypothetical protein [Candidatus Methylacidiphilales bacterium]
MLLEHGADANAIADDGEMLLHWAESPQGNKDIADLLRQRGGHE